MSRNVSIGDFARMTHLSIKTLRHYHDVGLLVPDDVDPATGYRYYACGQVAIAHVIKRFRELGMPIDDVRALLEASDPAVRNELILTHLDRLERQLAETRAAVASLRSLVERPEPVIAIEYRAIGELPVLAISDHVQLADLSRWWQAAFTELHAAVTAPTGPAGALFATELFAEEAGAVTAFIPTNASRESDRARAIVLPAVELALTTHRGSHADIDRTYGALGTHVAAQELGLAGPIREHYLVARFQTKDALRWRTEVGWPILRH